MTDMIRQWTYSRGPRAARLVLVTWLTATVFVLLSFKTGLAAEWVTPPGIDLQQQQQALRDRVMRAARGILGEQLVDVEVNIGYLRTGGGTVGRSAQQPDRIKLPGFNNFIVPSGEAGGAIVSDYSRVRQAFVMVSEASRVSPDSLARELAAQVGMDPAQGDTLRVVKVGAKGGDGMRDLPRDLPPQMPGLEEDDLAIEQRPKRARPMTPEELKEPASTAHLMQARRHYFAGDYQGSLDEIVEAIKTDPNNAQAYAMLGSLYYAMNWRSLAVKYWQRSLEIDPTNREIEDLVTQIRIQSP
jgi:hypothetical protein